MRLDKPHVLRDFVRRPPENTLADRGSYEGINVRVYISRLLKLP